ncbi:putative pentatricopeptide repeat-containing protein At1g56570 [Impatiens glandulifera]|uniref:putative pentatricopeptide repeat-containing protein At1g56570 n=1 Tax=Impatiens glandulifera TaxID=253017 RepID=UPI001FB13388|nr:putative pentatricopeptide repeat-containing protein At1g56570 [Impatiens glandulifera]XP_047341283.1 putative pentatricopeptide repeat-containing protein At1g56570 [Impatiens glandulifera]
MSSRNLLRRPTHHHHRIPQAVRAALQLPQQSSQPFQPKGASVLATNLIKSYCEIGLVKEAREMFDEMPVRDVVSWTALISGYVSCNQNSRAWSMFCDMVRDGRNRPNAFTFSSVLKACKGLGSLSSGALVHGLSIKHGLDGGLYVSNALIDMYASCSVSMHDASMVFEDIGQRTAVSWTTFIAGYTHRGDGYGGIQTFKRMLSEEVMPCSFSLSITVRACASISSPTCGKQIHAEVIKCGFESDIPVMNSLLDMYCRCNYLVEANQCFNETNPRDLITWNTLIAGYEKSDSTESLHIFSQMESSGFSPNCFTFTSIVAACANLTVLSFGQQVHGSIHRKGFERNLILANALIDMYAKCGNISDSYKVFTMMGERNLVSWTSMMIGYGSHGYGTEAVDLFNQMVESGVRPDRIVFIAVLGACSHAGLVNEGLTCFNKMVSEYKLAPDQEIYGCVVDLLGRAGKVMEAYGFIENMPFTADESVWGAFLGACREHRIPNIEKLVGRRIMAMKPNIPTTYLTLSNIYAAEGKWGEFAKIRKLMRGMRRRKQAGTSWVEVQNEVRSFVVGNNVGTDMEPIHLSLNMLVDHMKDDATDLDGIAES